MPHAAYSQKLLTYYCFEWVGTLIRYSYDNFDARHLALLLITVSKSRRDRNRNSGLVIALTSAALVIKRFYKRRFTSYDNRVNHFNYKRRNAQASQLGSERRHSFARQTAQTFAAYSGDDIMPSCTPPPNPHTTVLLLLFLWVNKCVWFYTNQFFVRSKQYLCEFLRILQCDGQDVAFSVIECSPI